MRRRSIIALALLVAALVPAAARARSLTIASLDVEIRVGRDGGLVVSETIRPRFTGEWNGIHRTIPVDYQTPQGFAHRLRLRVLDVSDGERPLRHEVTRDGPYEKIRIWIPEARDATRTVVLRYRVRNALGFFAGHDELYWNIIGDEWEVPIETATARIVLPPEAQGLRAAAFTGARGSRGHAADVAVAGNEVRLVMRGPLRPRQGLATVVGWDKGVVRPPGWLDRAATLLAANWPLAVPIALLPLLLAVWWGWGRDPRLGPIVVAYAPPPGLTPAEAGALVDGRADARDVSATLIDLAARGFLRIEQQPSGRHVLHRERVPPSRWEDLEPHEHAVLRALFESDAVNRVVLSALESSFHLHLERIRRRILDRLLDRRYYRSRPSAVRSAWLACGALAGILLSCGSSLRLGGLAAAPLAFLAGGVATAALLCGVGLVMPARTRAGTRALAAVLGFKAFLCRVERDRLARMERTPKLFERYLPYAIALGVEHDWAKAFRGIYQAPPRWYDGPHAHDCDPEGLVRDLGRLPGGAEPAVAATPPTSAASGIDGGAAGGF